MKPSLRDFLYFSKAQRRGVVILLLIIIGVYSFRLYLTVQTSEFDDDQLFYYAQIIDNEKKASPQANKFESSKIESPVKLFSFDPNLIDKKDWKALGFSEKQAQSILNYRAKGGEFKVKSDLRKLYVISDEKYLELKNFILLPDSIHLTERKSFQFSKEAPLIRIIELNTADSIDLISLKGIGPVYASRIMKYRGLLGGFYSIDQLNEVWGLKDSTILAIRPYLKIDTTTIQRLNINQLDQKSLSAHPYIDWNMAKAMVNFRKQHGRYSSLDELNKIYLLNDSLLQRIFPYLAVDKKDQ